MTTLDAPTPPTDTSLTVYRELEQRSATWYAARAGLVTASAVGRLITSGAPDAATFPCPECSASEHMSCVSLRNGQEIKTTHSGRLAVAAAAEPVLTVADNDTSRGLIATLAGERITGHVEETPTTGDMFRGIIAEPFARDAYAEHNEVEVEEVGFMVRDFGTYRIGCSPDGLVGEDGGIEIKSPRAKTHIATVLTGEIPAHYMAQVQTFLLVSGRSWCDFVSFHGGLPLWTTRVEPDPSWAAAIHRAAAYAESTIADTVTRFEEATDGLPPTERVPDPFAEIQV